MNFPPDSDWRPHWTTEEIESTVPTIARHLREGVYSTKIADFTRQSQGSTWWSRQFNIIQRAGHSQLQSVEETIQRLAKDAPRVLRLINAQWDTYVARVRMQRDQSQREEIFALAKQGPVELYLFLVTVHINKAWRTHSPGMEVSVASAWAKIGYDNQFLWSREQFESIIL